MHASYAFKLGLPVSGFQRESADGRPIVAFLCGECTATGADTRFVEVLVAGRHLTRLPSAVADLVLWSSDLYTADELVQEIKKACARAATERLARS